MEVSVTYSLFYENKTYTMRIKDKFKIIVYFLFTCNYLCPKYSKVLKHPMILSKVEVAKYTDK